LISKALHIHRAKGNIGDKHPDSKHSGYTRNEFEIGEFIGVLIKDGDSMASGYQPI
jgi:hypothetical protein